MINTMRCVVDFTALNAYLLYVHVHSNNDHGVDYARDNTVCSFCCMANTILAQL